MRPRPLRLLAALTACLAACAIERIDEIIAEHGVTYVPATESSTNTGSSSDTSTGTTVHSTEGESSTSGGTSAAADTSSSGSHSEGTTDTSDSTGEPPVICGDKLVTADEECDDGNDQDGDACRNDCTRRWIVFVTSAPDIGSGFNGITGADYECRHRATNMFLPNGERYMAWVSTSESEPADRMYHARGPYVLVTGVQVAAHWSALTSGTLEHPIDVTEKSESVAFAVWTGTDITGLRLPNTQHCSDWTSNDSKQTGWLADSTAIDASWTRGVEAPCGNGGAALYCIEQP